MSLIKGLLSSIILQVAVLVLLHMPADILAAETDSCLECHKINVDDELRKTYIHPPFLEKKCALCHSPDWVKNAADSNGKSLLPQKTKKLGRDDNPARTHLFSIPKEYDLTILFIEAFNKTSESYRVKLKIDPFDSLNTLSSDDKPPEINAVEVIEVIKDSLASAKIQWHTDELSSSEINYGMVQPGSHAVGSGEFLSKHTVELYSLKPDVTYHFKIISEDIYGNSKESRAYSFSTDKSYSLIEDAHRESSTEPLKLRSEVFRSEDNYLIRISTNQDVGMEISTYDLPGATMLQNPADFPENHPSMKSIYETNVLLCQTCHRILSGKFPHPVHFRARLGNNIPPEYPRLANGQMSCLTCHEYHASSNAIYLRKSSERELCIGCHKRSFRNQ